MNAVKGLAAGFVVLVLALAVIAGLSSGEGRVVWDNVVAAVETTLQWTADQIVRLSDLLNTRGEDVRSLIAGVVLFSILVFTVPYFRKSPASILILLVISAGSAYILYDPTILPSV